jgi:hypothetical protein
MLSKIGFVLCCACLLFMQAAVYAQAPDTLWTKHYGSSDDDQAWQIKPTSDNGFIVVGFTDIGDPSDIDMYLIRTDENGDSIWTRTFDYLTLVDIGRSVAPLEDGGFVITGYSNIFSYDDDLILFKVDSLGNREWFSIYTAASGRSVKVNNDGSFIIAGFAPGSDNDQDMYFARHDSAGTQIWSQTYGGLLNEKAWDVCESPNGGFAVIGWTESFGIGGSDIFLVRIDNDGNILWFRTYGSNFDDEGRSILTKEDGGFILAGKIASGISMANTAIISVDSNGDVIWSRTFSDTVRTIANSIVATTDGGYIITGMRFDSNYMFSSFIIKISADGDSLWGTILEDPQQNLYCRSVVQADDGGYVVAGYHQIPNNNNDVFLCKLAPDIVGVQDEIAILPGKITLHQNYPNPFNASTTISFTLSKPGNVVLTIYDLLGRKISVLVDGYFEAGSHVITFDAGPFTSGIYFYNLKARDISEMKSMILLK